MRTRSSHDIGRKTAVDMKGRTTKRSRFLVMVAVAMLLTAGILLMFSAAPTGRVLAQESVATPAATPAPGQRPGRDAGDGSGRRPGGQAGNQPARPDGTQPDASPTVSPSAQAPTATVSAAAQTPDIVLDVTVDRSSSIVAIAGIDGAALADRPLGPTRTIAPMGTAMQAAGRTEDGKWLYVVGDAVIKGGQEVTPAVAGWTSAADLFAFSVENLPVLDVERTQILLPDLGEDESSEPDDPQSTDVDGKKPALPVDDAVETTAGPDLEPDSAQNAELGGADGEVTTAVTGIVNLVDSRLNVRAGPSTTTAITGKLQPNQPVTVLGRSEDRAWLLISEGGSADPMGWAAVDFVGMNVDLESVPIVPSSTISDQSSTSGATLTPAPLNEDRPASAGTAGITPPGSGEVMVVQTSPGAMFYAYNLVNGALWPLSRGFDPAISPDGQTVAFTRDGGENGIYLIDVDGGNERHIFAERGRLASPKWRPDGQWIVFSRGNTYAECYQMGRSCQTATEIKERNPNVDLSKFELVKEPRYHLAMVDLNGENYTDIAALDTARAPDWNQAGIVYQSSAGLQITDVSPGAENRLVIDDYLKPYFHDPDWQPGQGSGGGRIAYMGKEGSHWEIFTVNPDGSGVTALTRPSTTLAGVLPSNVAPAWSPDGSRIAFLSNRADGGGSDIWRLWIMDADGSNQRALPIDLDMDYTFGDEQAVGW